MSLDFPIDFTSNLISKIDEILPTLSGPLYAAFDADGTLWNTDMGENFFHYQINNNLLSNLPKDPWNHYLNLKKDISPPTAYLWLAQINKGVSLDTIRGWARDCVKQLSPLPIFEGQKRIIAHLHKKGVKVYVVTASIKWSVEPAAQLYNIPYDCVLGVQTKIDNNIITDQQEGPITWRQGKVEALKEATSDMVPFFCSGNTPGDLALLEFSSHLKLTLAFSNQEPGLFKEELMLQKIAKENKWYHIGI